MKKQNLLKLLLPSLLLMAAMTVDASPITVEKAQGNARDFLSSSTGMRRVRGNTNMKLACSIDAPTTMGYSAASSQPTMYAFNLEGGGFILASGDDAAEPILGYSEHGSFNLDSLPPNAKLWIESYAKEIAWARQNGLTAKSRNEAKTNSPRKARVYVGAMLSTTWDQDAPYNDQCIFNGTRCYTGCGATAMAQILCYWAKKGFKRGCKALPAYTTDTKKYKVSALGAVSAFDWANMTSNSTPSNSTQKAAVAKLMRYCGQSVKMDYTPDWSASYTSDVCNSLKNNFFYNSGITYIYHDDKTASQYEAMVYNEIASGRPAILTGYNSDWSNGHFFICDGYNNSNGKYHFNWGWEGWCDNWFSLTALNPDGYNFNYYKEAIIGINPNTASQYVTQSADSKTITFYCNNNKSAHSSETIYDLEDFRYNLKNKTSITKVVFDSSFANARPTSTYAWFEEMSALTTITNIGYLNTSSVTNMSSMFNGCSKLTSINLSKFNTANVTNMSSMFYNCKALKSLSFSSFNTAKVTNMYNMFSGCSALTSLDLSKFNTAKVTSMSSMFQNCSALKSVTLTSFNTAAVTTISYMFDGCSALTGLDLSKFNLSKLTSSSYFMQNCKALKTLSIPSTMSKASTNAFTNVGTTAAPCVITAPSGFNFGVTTTGLYFKWKSGYFFLSGNKVSYALQSGTKLSFFHDASPWSRSGSKYALNSGTSNPGWSGNNATTTEVAFDASFAASRPTSTYKWFSGMAKLTKITNIGNLNTSSTTNMDYMFDGCSALTGLDLSKFNMSKVTSSTYMVRNCKALKTLSIPSTMTKANENAFTSVGTTSAPCIITAPSGFNFGVSITGLYFKWKSGYFFLNGNKVSYAWLSGTKLSFFHDASPWTRSGNKYALNTGTNNPAWSGSNASITEVAFDASFAASRPTSTYKWFSGMAKLTKITNIGNLNTSSTTNMDYMFDGCSALSGLDLSKFDLSKVTSSTYMVRNCKALKTLSIPSTMTKANENAFTNVGTTSAPCIITAPSGFNFGVGLADLYFKWKSGYFFLNGNKVSYAWLSGTKLSFFHDASPWTRSGSKYTLNTGTNNPGWSGSNASITEVAFDASFAASRPTSTYKWFSGMTSLTTVSGIGNLNMSAVTNTNNMFYGCTKLASITLPSTINGIGVSMFQNCSSLKTIDIPASVKSIGDNAFNGCSKQEQVTVRFSTPLTITASTFSNRKNAFLSVPNGCRKAFETANYWKEFKGFLEDGKFSLGDVNHDGVLTLKDVSTLIDFILDKNPNGYFNDCGDVNKDGMVSVADVTNIVNYILE